MSQAGQILMAQTSQNSTRSAALARRKSQSSQGKSADSEQPDRAQTLTGQQSATGGADHSTRSKALARRKAMSESGKVASDSKDRIRGQNDHRSEKPNTHSSESSTELSKSVTSGEMNARPEGSVQSTNTTTSKMSSSTSKQAALERRRNRSAFGKASPAKHEASDKETSSPMTSREISQSVRGQRSTKGKSWKVGLSETSRGQNVTGTMLGRNLSITGTEASTCRDVTGIEYLEANVYKEFCKSEPSKSITRSGMSSTNKGNSITGNRVNRSLRVTGDEPGSCKNITGTDYISVEDSDKFCTTTSSAPTMIVSGATNITTRKGKTITGDSVGNTGILTGADAGAGMEPTGAQYTLGSNNGRSSTKRYMDEVKSDGGSARVSLGDKKVSFSETFNGPVISGNIDGRTDLITGNEPGVCNAITGTPYSGLDDYSSCNQEAFDEASKRAQRKLTGFGKSLTGIQPSVGGTMTGDKKGACEEVTGTPYVGEGQIAEICNNLESHANSDSDNLDGDFKNFSINSPGHASKTMDKDFAEHINSSKNHITGSFEMGSEIVTGTDDERFGAQPKLGDRNMLNGGTVNNRVKSRVSGEGMDVTLKITGDDWDRGDRITGTEGLSATVRNPSIRGPRNAMINRTICKEKNDAPHPTNLVTGSSGNYKEGSLITYSGGARG